MSVPPPIQAASIALGVGLFKVAASKIVPPITSEIASIKSVTKDLSELQDIHGDISRFLSRACKRANDPDGILSPPCWVLKLEEIAEDIDDLLREVHLESERNMINSCGQKYYAIVDLFPGKPKSFMFQCKVAHRIKAIKKTYAAIAKQRTDSNAILNNFPLDNPVSGQSIRSEEPSSLANIEEPNLEEDQGRDDDTGCTLSESDEGNDGWIVVTRNLAQSS